MAIFRVSAEWSGFPGAPGYSNFHFQGSSPDSSPTGERALVHEFFRLLRPMMPPVVTIDVRPTIEIFDEATGQLVDYHLDTTELDPIDGSSQGNYSGPSGAVVHWLTNSVVNGRRLRGRTFLVPLATAVYDGTGTIATQELGMINDAASVLSGAGFSSGFGVWSRPSSGGSGAFGEVVAHQVPDMAAVLRSRRD